MKRYRYRALRERGGEIEGEILAADEREAVQHLQADGHLPIEIAPPRARTKRRLLPRAPLSARERILLARQLAALLAAGVAVDRAFELIAGEHRAGRRGRVAGAVLDALRRGESLSHALGETRAFAPAFTMIVAAGEARGDLGLALERNAAILERNRAIGQAFANALIYPASVLVVAMISVSFLLTVVVPRFAVLAQSFRHDPPFALSLLLAISSLFQAAALPTLALLALAVAYGAFRWRDRAFRARTLRRLQSVPALGTLVMKLETERLGFLLGTMVEAGVALPVALAAARDGMANWALRAGLAEACRSLERGDRLSAALAAAGFVPELALELVRVGEETGDVATMLLKASDMLRSEVEATATEWVALVAPLSMVALGIVIGAIALAMFSTVLEVYDLAT